ncbi:MULTISPECIES: pentapeptide repeat-containing protein [Limnospira]|uniref:Pentapeptide repeat n=1 Tax=Limnospira indica PCC 8005 TaxID=376219 RepID=A0A9P1KKF1_9CYAN|nr:hypothetical protein HFV01_30620 [Limnospira fusiformis SAG 85.79]QNH57361.1 MAG: pentapeptide repeat-containing protein [Limnospira indica BM01]CDM98078.1 Pentapeptide repeat [Limnospira indica PCC 8005]
MGYASLDQTNLHQTRLYNTNLKAADLAKAKPTDLTRLYLSQSRYPKGVSTARS